MALHGRMGTFEASQDSQPRVRFGVRWGGERGGTGLLKWASPPHVDFAFPPASLPRPRTTQPWFFHLLPTKTLSRDSSIHVEGGKGGETNPFDLRWGSGAERESPYHRNKVGFSKSALPLRRKDLPLQVVILRAQECSLSWQVRTLRTHTPYVLSVCTLRIDSPYVLSVRTLRTYSLHVLSVRTLRT